VLAYPDFCPGSRKVTKENKLLIILLEVD